MILLVEDDADIREALIELLDRLGHRTVGAANGLEALAYLRANPAPRLILLDPMKPVRSGCEFRWRQLMEEGLGAIRVVLLSAHANLEQNAEALHVAAFVAKPIDLDQLVEAVEHYGPLC